MSWNRERDVFEWCNSSGLFELDLLQIHIDAQPRQGDCIISVQQALNTHHCKEQFARYDEQTTLNTAYELGYCGYGCDEKELAQATLKGAQEFILWCAIGDAQDEQFEAMEG